MSEYEHYLSFGEDVEEDVSNIYIATTASWVGNHNRILSTFWVVCKEKPDVRLLNEYFEKMSAGWTDKIRLAKYKPFKEESADTFWLEGEVLYWENDLEKMLNQKHDDIWKLHVSYYISPENSEWDDYVKKTAAPLISDNKRALEHLKDTMIEEIEDNWEKLTEAGYGAERDMPDAAYYLGHSVDDMSQEEIDEEVSDLQLAYYTTGEAELDEIVEKYNQIFEC